MNTMYSNLLYNLGFDITMSAPVLHNFLRHTFINPDMVSTGVYSELMLNKHFLTNAMKSYLYVPTRDSILTQANALMYSNMYPKVDFISMLSANYANLYTAIMALTCIFFAKPTMLMITRMAVWMSNRTTVTEGMLSNLNLVVKTQSLFDTKLWILFCRISNCQIPFAAMVTSYGCKVFMLFMVNVIIANKVHDEAFIMMLNNYVVLIAQKLQHVGDNWHLMPSVYKLFTQTLLAILIQCGNLPEYASMAYTVAEQNAINLADSTHTTALMLQAGEISSYVLSGDITYIMECYGNAPNNVNFYKIAVDVYSAIQDDSKMKNPWDNNKAICPWQLQGVLSVTPSMPISTFGYIAGITLVLSRYALRCYLN